MPGALYSERTLLARAERSNGPSKMRARGARPAQVHWSVHGEDHPAVVVASQGAHHQLGTFRVNQWSQRWLCAPAAVY